MADPKMEDILAEKNHQNSHIVYYIYMVNPSFLWVFLFTKHGILNVIHLFACAVKTWMVRTIQIIEI